MTKRNKTAITELRVGVLYGGISSEREVSLVSGAAVSRGLKDAGCTVADIDVRGDFEERLPEIAREIDLAFIVLHGEFGEDGRIQQLLEDVSIPFTGSDSASSRIGMDKLLSKSKFIKKTIPVPDAAVPKKHSVDWQGTFPCVVKPVFGGSSIDVFLPATPRELESVLKKTEGLFVEEYIQGREFTVGVLDGQTLPAIEIKSCHEFYDFNAKYEDEQTGFLFDTLPKVRQAELSTLALQAFDAIGARDFGRIDMIMDAQGNFFVLEVNTIPGFTSHSLLPMAAARMGIDFPSLCRRILEVAARRLTGTRNG